jgi:hypothetical protein
MSLNDASIKQSSLIVRVENRHTFDTIVSNV